MNYQNLFDVFTMEYSGKDARIQETDKQKATLFVKWLVRNGYLRIIEGGKR